MKWNPDWLKGRKRIALRFPDGSIVEQVRIPDRPSIRSGIEVDEFLHSEGIVVREGDER